MRHWKILGLSLLALVGVMAVSASAAQAEWQLLLNEEVVPSLTLQGDLPEGHMFVHELGLTIACTSGTANAKVSGTTTLSGVGSATFTGCDVAEAEEVCEVNSPGQPDGTIVASGEGTATDEGPEIVKALLEDDEFANIIIEGEECAVAEFDGTVHGTAILTVLNALQDLKSHVIHLDEEELFYGEHPALLLTDTTDDVLGEAFDVDPDATWAIHLINLK